MSVNSLEIMKTIDERELQKKQQKKNKGRKEQGEQKL